MKFRAFLPMVLAALLMACNSSSKKDLVENAPFVSLTITDDLEQEIALPEKPKTIISLSPGITETIYAIGAEDMLIARSDACNYPEWVEEKPGIKINPLLDRDSVLTFKSDLVFASDETVSTEEAMFFQSFKQPSYFQSFTSIGDIYRHIREMGKLLDHEAEANHLADSLETIEKLIVAETADEIKYSTVILISIDPLIVAGRGSFMHELIAKAGGKNAFEDKYEKYPLVTPEEMIKANVEFIIIPSGNSSQNMLNQLTGLYPQLAALPAVQLRQVFDNLPPEYILRPGPRTVEGLGMLTRVLHSGIDTQSFFEVPEEEDDEEW